MGPIAVISLIVVGGLLVAAFVVVGLYNGLVARRVACEHGWAQIDVQLKRRHDLIPNLVETVSGYAKHEQQTLERVVEARRQAVDASGIEAQASAENVLSGALRQLFAVAEAYPDLKANENFMQLQSELASIEDKIAGARTFYNGRVGVYNTAIEQFPGNVIAGLFRFERRAFFEVEETAARAAPRVAF